MRPYRIRRTCRAGEGYETMVITDRETGAHIAEYRLTPGCEISEIAQMRRAINEHLDSPDGGLGNYQW